MVDQPTGKGQKRKTGNASPKVKEAKAPKVLKNIVPVQVPVVPGQIIESIADVSVRLLWLADDLAQGKYLLVINPTPEQLERYQCLASCYNEVYFGDENECSIRDLYPDVPLNWRPSLDALAEWLEEKLGDPPEEGCDNTTKHTQTFLTEVCTKLTADQCQQFLEELAQQGGYCDCEMLYNVIIPSWEAEAAAEKAERLR